VLIADLFPAGVEFSSWQSQKVMAPKNFCYTIWITTLCTTRCHTLCHTL
jgi:hypothetical protein